MTHCKAVPGLERSWHKQYYATLQFLADGDVKPALWACTSLTVFYVVKLATVTCRLYKHAQLFVHPVYSLSPVLVCHSSLQLSVQKSPCKQGPAGTSRHDDKMSHITTLPTSAAGMSQAEVQTGISTTATEGIVTSTVGMTCTMKKQTGQGVTDTVRRQTGTIAGRAESTGTPVKGAVMTAGSGVKLMTMSPELIDVAERSVMLIWSLTAGMCLNQVAMGVRKAAAMMHMCVTAIDICDLQQNNARMRAAQVVKQVNTELNLFAQIRVECSTTEDTAVTWLKSRAILLNTWCPAVLTCVMHGL